MKEQSCEHKNVEVKEKSYPNGEKHIVKCCLDCTKKWAVTNESE